MRLYVAATIVTALVLAACNSSSAVNPGPPDVRPAKLQHVIILIQENRSFDNIFAGFPGADTAMQGLCKPKRPWCKSAQEIPLKPVKLKDGPINQGTDIDHTHRAFKTECDADSSGACQMDGFDLMRSGEAGNGYALKLYPYAYVNRAEVAPYWDLAKRYTLADKMFSTDTASSFIAHQQFVAGTARWNDVSSLTDEPNVPPWGCDAAGPSDKHRFIFTPLLFKNGKYNSQGPFPCFSQYGTIADLLDAGNTSYSYYVDSFKGARYNDFSGAVWNGFDPIKKVSCPVRNRNASGTFVCTRGPDWSHISIPNTNIFADLQDGKLAAVSWVIPTLYDSDHPAAGCNGGPWWVSRVVNAVGASQYWKSSAVLLLWDDWGGWYDNAPPPQVDYTSLGGRVPMVVISPYAKPHFISHTQYDFGSVLKLIETTFHLGSLGTSDAPANAMDDVFDFTARPNAYRPLKVPKPSSCATKLTNANGTNEVIEHDGGPPG